MKLFAKLMLAVLVIAMLLPFTILKGDNGRPLLSFSDFSWPDFSTATLPKAPMVDSMSDSADSSGGKNTVYRWFDSEGNIQFTTDPPPQGIEFEVRNFDPDVNVIQPVKLQSGETPVVQAETDPENSSAPVDQDLNPYSAESLKKLFENAKNVEKLLNQRFRSQESATNQ